MQYSNFIQQSNDNACKPNFLLTFISMKNVCVCRRHESSTVSFPLDNDFGQRCLPASEPSFILAATPHLAQPPEKQWFFLYSAKL